MITLFILMLLTISLGWVYEHAYVGIKSNTLEKQKISIVFIVLTLILGIFLGLRTKYNDTGTYILVYNTLKTFPAFWNDFDPSLSKDPGFNLCNAILKTLGLSTQSWLMLYSLVTIALYMHFIRKYKNNLPLNLFLFFCVGSYTFAGAAIKQSIATAICLCAIPYALDKKWFKYCLMIFIAMTFHVYSVVFLFVPFLTFKPFTQKTLFLILGSVLVAFSMKFLLGAIVDITAGMGETYSLEEFSGEGVNIFRVLVCNVPLILALFFHKDIFKNSTKEENLFFNMAMVNGCIMFIGIFGTANYFARLANYFVIAQAITLPNIIKKLSGTNKKIILFFMILLYVLYFYYSENIVHGEFNMHQISLWEFIKQL